MTAEFGKILKVLLNIIRHRVKSEVYSSLKSACTAGENGKICTSSSRRRLCSVDTKFPGTMLVRADMLWFHYENLEI